MAHVDGSGTPPTPGLNNLTTQCVERISLRNVKIRHEPNSRNPRLRHRYHQALMTNQQKH